jgi:hypothetical protein
MTRRLTRRKLLAIETALEVCERMGSRAFRAVAESLPEPSPARLRDVHDALEWARRTRDARLAALAVSISKRKRRNAAAGPKKRTSGV